MESKNNIKNTEGGMKVRKYSKPPYRKIAKAFTGSAPLEKKGHRFNVILECGHWDELTKTEMRAKTHTCFDCYYGKEVDELAKIELEILKK